MPNKKQQLIVEYLKEGFRAIPLQPREKRPRDKDWTNESYAPGVKDFEKDDNVAWRLDNVVDFDLDAMEVVAIAPAFMPVTQCIFGRKSKPKSHWLYRCSKFTTPLVLKDGDGTILLEVRTGHKHETMVPPSIHPSGEKVEWEARGGLANISLETLHRTGALLASTAAIIRAYPPPGEKHDWHLAVVGSLKQLGVTEDEAKKMVRASALAVSAPKLPDRLLELSTTYARTDSDAIAGFRTLLTLDKGLAQTLQKLLGVDDPLVRGFIGNASGGVATTNPENIRRALQRLKVDVSLNTFKDQKVVKHGERNRDLDDKISVKLRMSIHREFNFLPMKDLFADTVLDMAMTHPFHPVRDYLEKLVWDGEPRIDRWLTTYAAAEDSEYVSEVGRLTLIAAVRRVYEPGIKFDEILVLESPQGWGKSTALIALCPKIEWFSDDLPIGVGSKLVIERTKGKWIIEIAELFGLSRREIDQVKGFLSRSTDGPVRLAYGRESTYVKRQFIVIGTTNKSEYLRDATGNRRFWPVKVQHFDVNRLREDRDQIWAEATARRTEPIRLEQKYWNIAAQEQRKREVEHPWEADIRDFFDDPPDHIQLKLKGGGGVEGLGRLRVRVSEVWDSLGIPLEKRDVQGQDAIIGILQKLGFKKMIFRRKDKTVRGWGRDE